MKRHLLLAGFTCLLTLPSYHTAIAVDTAVQQVNDSVSQPNQDRPPFDTSPHPVLPDFFQRSPQLLRSECGKCHTTQAFIHLNVEKQSVETLPEVPIEGITCRACHSTLSSSPGENLRITGDTTLESGHVFTDGKAGLCVSCHQSRVKTDLSNYIANEPTGPHFGTQADILMGINAWDFGRGLRTGESIHKLAIQDSCVACHMATVPANGRDPVTGTLVGSHSFKIYNNRGTADTADDVSNLRNTCMPCHLTIQSVDRVLSTGRDYDGNGRIEGTQSEVKGLLTRISSLLKSRHPAITVEASGALTMSRSEYQSLPFNEKAAVYNHRLIQRDGSAGIHNGSFAVEVLQKTYEALQGHSLKVDAPAAYMVGTTELDSWIHY